MNQDLVLAAATMCMSIGCSDNCRREKQGFLWVPHNGYPAILCSTVVVDKIDYHNQHTAFDPEPTIRRPRQNCHRKRLSCETTSRIDHVHLVDCACIKILHTNSQPNKTGSAFDAEICGNIGVREIVHCDPVGMIGI